MTPRWRWILLAILTVLALGGAGAFAVDAYLGYRERSTGPSQVATAAVLPTGPSVLFRNTAAGEGYGMLASVALGEPAGPRTLTGTACDRVYRTGATVSCLRTVRGISTTFKAVAWDTGGQGTGQESEWALAGIPSRTRVSADGLVATTSFVTGHSYAADGFSTETVIESPDGRDYGNLEKFTMTVGGRELTATDRNVWGVTFANDGDTFYATVASGGSTWLMRGSLSARTLDALAENAECPSLSPDGGEVAYKKRRPGTTPAEWDIAVLDLGGGTERTIELEDGIDDQLEWLDTDTLLYGQPRAGTVGDSDVWSIGTTPGALPELFIEHAWSPSVQR